jgi:nucleotide-binding universal stress UspA family protein
LSASFRDVQIECVVSVGRPAEAIASLAVEHGAGLVVMGLADPGNSEPRAPGSTAYSVLRSAHVAVVVVPHSEAQPEQNELARRARPSIARGSRAE